MPLTSSAPTFGRTEVLMSVATVAPARTWLHWIGMSALDLVIATAVTIASVAVAVPAVRAQGYSNLWFGGTAVAILMLVPVRRWWIYVAVFAVGTATAMIQGGFFVSHSILRTVTDVVVTCLAAWVLRDRLVLPLRRPVDAWLLIIVSTLAGIARFAAGSIGLLLWPVDGVDWAMLPISLALNTLIGMLVLIPLIVLTARRVSWQGLTRNSVISSLAIVVALGILVWLAFGRSHNEAFLGVAFLTIPLLMVLAARYSQLALAAGLAVVAIGTSTATSQRLGPFAAHSDSLEAMRSASLNLQVFLFAIPAAAWVLAAAVADSRRTTAELAAQVAEQKALAERLAVAEEHFRAAVTRTAIPMSFGPIGSNLWEMNDAMCEFYGLPSEALRKRTWESLTHPDDIAEDRRLTELLVRNEIDRYQLLKRYILDDGTVKWGRLTLSSAQLGEAKTDWAIAQIVDVTAEVRAMQELARSEELFQAAVMRAPIPMSFGPLGGGLREVNDARCAFHERTREELAGIDWRALTHPDDVAAEEELTETLLNGETNVIRLTKRYLMPDGRVKVGDLTISRIPGPDDEGDYALAQIVDITAEVRAREALEDLVNTDLVTGLLSRSRITDVLQESLTRANDTSTQVGVMFIDLTEFLFVNRTLGYQAGDDVLRSISDGIRSHLTPHAHVGRFDGHNLVVVMPDATVEHLDATANTLLAQIADEKTVQGNRVSRPGSIGMALSKRHSTASSLLRDADHALALAKAKGRSRAHLLDQPGTAETALHYLELEHELRNALDGDQFIVYFQPQVRLDDRRIVGYEALVRWNHPTRGVLSPIAFMDTMEQSGLVIPLGRQVLEQVCRAIATNPELPGPVSVNVSAVEFGDAMWLEHFTHTVRAFAIPGDRLVVELTETTALQLTDDARRALTGIRDLGFGIHIDDFGTGYASVGVLRQIPVTALKLDRSFTAPLKDGALADLAVIRGIAALATGLGLETIAEGIETEAQADLVRAAGWSLGQGYLFGKPSATILV